MQTLEEQFNAEVEKTVIVFKNFNWEHQANYVQWLVQTYYFARTTTRLLSLVAAHIPYEMSKIHARFVDHAKEERNHEILLERDLKRLGFDIKDCPEHSVTSAFYQSQYYWIQHKDPLSFFGYILILEGVAAVFGDEGFLRVAAAHGNDAVSFVKVHALEDKSHVQSALTELQQLPEKTRLLIQQNLRFSTDLYIQLIKDCEKVKSTQRFDKAG